MKKAVLYLRYSSAGQTEQSIEGQRRVCTDYAERNDLKIVGEYIDRATSAAHDTQKRKSFLRMISDSSKHGFEAVIVYKLDRFARNRYDSANYKQKLKANGVSVISATEGISGDPESVILESVLEGMAEYYSLELSQKVRRGINESIEKRQWLGGQVPLGFRVENKTLVPDPVTAPIIKEIFQMALDGDSFADLVSRINAAGLRNKYGKPFSRNVLSSILHNKRYIGYYKHKDLEIPGVLEPIIDEKTFYKVQEILKMHKGKKRSKKEKYLLSGKLFCGHCGHNMNGEAGTSKTGDRHFYYKCYDRKHGTCTKKPVKRDAIDNFVVSKCLELLTPEKIDLIADKVIEIYEAENDIQVRIEALKEDKKAIGRKIDNLMDAIADGFRSSSIKDKLASLELQQSQIQAQIDDLEVQHPKLTKSMVVFWLNRFKAKADKPDGKAALINAFVARVELFDEDDKKNSKVIIHFNLAESFNEGEPFDFCTQTPAIRNQSSS